MVILLIIGFICLWLILFLALSTVSNSAARVVRQSSRDFLGYLGEFIAPFRVCFGHRAPSQGSDAWTSVQEAVDTHEVVIFKMEGCGFCQRAEMQLDTKGVAFFATTGADPEIRSVLQHELLLPVLTFPVVFVQGFYLGGFDQLDEALDSGRFAELCAKERQPFPKGIGFVEDSLKLFEGPRGQPWYSFQLHVYANYVRLVSLFQIVLFAMVLLLMGSLPAVAMLILWVVAIDMAIFTVMGPTPLAPLSTLVTVIVWRFRGPAVTSLPYKAVMGAFYVVALASTLACGLDMQTCKADLHNSRGILISLMLNSTLLSIFRF